MAAAAVAAVRIGRRAQDREFAGGLVAIGDDAATSAAAALPARRPAAPCAPSSARRAIVGADAGRLDQLGDDALVHVGILAQVERGEMEAEHVDGAAQRRAGGRAPGRPSRCASSDRSMRIEIGVAAPAPIRRAAPARPAGAAPRACRAPRRWRPAARRCRRWRGGRVRPGAAANGRASAPPARARPSETRTMRPSSDSSPPSRCSSSR